METAIYDGICRCCASEGSFKDVNDTYHWMGEEEVYADMLKECFNVSLSLSAEQNGGICEVCITQLRNASNFKKQVLHTEEQFQKHLHMKIFKPVKIEVDTLENKHENDDNSSIEDGFSGTEIDMPIKSEDTPEEAKPKKRAAKTAKSKTKKSKSEKAETSNQRKGHTAKTDKIKREERLVARGKGSTKLKVIRLKSAKSVTWVKKKKSDERKGKRTTIQIPPEPRKRVVKFGQIDKHYNNIEQILQCSNATPIRCHTTTGYACCFCDNQYTAPEQLKEHTIQTHQDFAQANFFKTRRIDQFMVKLDITTLQCKLCGCSQDTLEQLLEHLRNAHDVNIYTDINNQIVPFKFESASLACCICSIEFHKFRTLLWHMNSHYRNFVCDVCDVGFVNNGNLTDHRRTHVTGTFVCDYCAQVFDTHVKKKSHEQRIHIQSRFLYRCGYCDVMFRDYRRKELHVTEVHNVEPLVYKCQACNKTFKNRGVLYIHVKRHHLLERKHKCQYCDMGFFSKQELNNHTVKHTGAREFQCDVCLKTFGRKNTLRGHMRTHANERRY